MTVICIWGGLTANDITALSTALLAIATFILGGAAFLQYQKNSEIKRAEFLMSLYEKFYGNKELKEIREWIDQEPAKEKEDFEKKKADYDKNKQAEEDKFEAKFTDYLNFFQFIVVLKNLGQLKEDEINQMFNYYLKLLKKSEFIMGYLSSNGYKELKSFLLTYKDDK